MHKDGNDLIACIRILGDKLVALEFFPKAVEMSYGAWLWLCLPQHEKVTTMFEPLGEPLCQKKETTAMKKSRLIKVCSNFEGPFPKYEVTHRLGWFTQGMK